MTDPLDLDATRLEIWLKNNQGRFAAIIDPTLVASLDAALRQTRKERDEARDELSNWTEDQVMLDLQRERDEAQKKARFYEVQYQDEIGINGLIEERDAALKERDEAHAKGFKDAIEKTAPGWRELSLAFRMIRDAVEELGPVGAVPSRAVGHPDFLGEAEDIIAGIRAIEAATFEVGQRAERDRIVQMLAEPSEQRRRALLEAAAEWADDWFGLSHWPLRGMDSVLVSFLRSPQVAKIIAEGRE